MIAVRRAAAAAPRRSCSPPGVQRSSASPRTSHGAPSSQHERAVGQLAGRASCGAARGRRAARACSRASIASAPRSPGGARPDRDEAVVVRAPAERARPVAGGERGRLVEEEQLGEPARLHQRRAVPAAERSRHAIQRRPLKRRRMRPGLVVQAAAVAVDEAARRVGDQLAERGDAVLQGHRSRVVCAVMAPEANWAGNHGYRARTAAPAGHRSSELQEIVAAAPRVRVLGSRHSFNDIADSDELVSLDGAARRRRRSTATRAPSRSAARLRYGELADGARRRGGWRCTTSPRCRTSRSRARSRPPRTARATATATSRPRSPRSSWSPRTARSSRPRAATRTSTAWSSASARSARSPASRSTSSPPTRSASACSRASPGTRCSSTSTRSRPPATASACSRAGATTSTRCGSRAATDAETPRPSCSARAAATVDRHPILGIDPVNCTAQLGVARAVVGSPAALPHGLHAERRARSCSPSSTSPRAPRGRRDRGRPRAGRQASGPSSRSTEIRTIAADRLWLSPQYERDSVAIHFTWNRDPEAVERVLVDVEAALAPFDARPHWGKLFLGTRRRPLRAHATTSSRSPRGSTRAARSATAGSNGM